MARVEFVDHVPVPASVPVRFVRASGVGHEGLIVGPSPCLGLSSEARREQRGQALPVSAESLLVLQEDAVEVQQDVHRAGVGAGGASLRIAGTGK